MDARCPALRQGKCPKSVCCGRVEAGMGRVGMTGGKQGVSELGPCRVGTPNDVGSGSSQGLGTAVAWLGVPQCSRCLRWVSQVPITGFQRLTAGQRMGARGGTLGTMGAAWRCLPCAQLGLVHSCSRLGCTRAVPRAPLWDVSLPGLRTPKPAAPRGWRGCRAGTGVWGVAGCWGPLQGESRPGRPQPPGLCRARPPAGSPRPVKRTRGENAPGAARCKLPVESLIQTMGSG